MSDSTGKNSDPDEQFARGCKTSLRAGRWLEGRASAGTFTSTAQMGLFASIPAATQYLQCSETKGTKSRTVQIVTLSRARREFRAGLHEPSGGRRGQLRTNYSRSQVFQLGQAWVREGCTATSFGSHFIIWSSIKNWFGKDDRINRSL